MKNLNKILFAALAMSGFAHAYEDSCSSSCRGTNHNVQFQLFDAYGWPVENTEFWTTIKLYKEGNRITLSLPAINFQTGQYAAADPAREELAGSGITIFEGGTLRAVDGFLPKAYCPTDPMYRSYVVPSNNGQSLAFSYTTTFSDLPLPPAGYMLSINYSGQLIIQGVGTFNNAIAPGFQVMAPTDVTYYHERTKKLCENVAISNGASNITAFTYAANDGYRDTHINDADKGIVGCAWTSNSNINQSQNTLNVMVSIGVVKNGKLEMGAPVQLTDLPRDVIAWDTAVAIDRVSTDTIIVSYGIVDYTATNLPFGVLNPPCRAVSFDGGKTWPAPYKYTSFFGEISDTTLTVTNVLHGALSVGDTIYSYAATSTDQVVEMYTSVIGLGTGTGGVGTYYIDKSQNVDGVIMNASPQNNGIVPLCSPYSFGFGDCRGVGSDKYGNIWYDVTNLIVSPNGPLLNQPNFWISTDGGLTFGTEPVFTLQPEVSVPGGYLDYPQFCFGGDESGNYGLWAAASHLFDSEVIDAIQTVGFVPINGPGDVGSGSNVFLSQLPNNVYDPDIAAAQDGRVWLSDGGNILGAYIANTLLFKSPGALDSNYAGAWQNAATNNYSGLNSDFGAAPFEYSSYPGFGYSDNARLILYDNKRQALYAVFAQNAPDLSQNMTLFLIISRNNGQTWSEPFEIASSTFANRGYQSMSLDTATGDLIFTWYDGRNDPTEQSVEYYGAVIPSKKLDRMVKNIPLSNPTYLTGSAA